MKTITPLIGWALVWCSQPGANCPGKPSLHSLIPFTQLHEAEVHTPEACAASASLLKELLSLGSACTIWKDGCRLCRARSGKHWQVMCDAISLNVIHFNSYQAISDVSVHTHSEYASNVMTCDDTWRHDDVCLPIQVFSVNLVQLMDSPRANSSSLWCLYWFWWLSEQDSRRPRLKPFQMNTANQQGHIVDQIPDCVRWWYALAFASTPFPWRKSLVLRTSLTQVYVLSIVICTACT